MDLGAASGAWERLGSGAEGSGLSVALAVGQLLALAAQGDARAALPSAQQQLSALLPRSPALLQPCTAEADSLSPTLALLLPPLLLSYASLLARLHSPQAPLRDQAQLLVSMAGMLQHRMPSDVFARLIAIASAMK